jgi:hypothetical protein
MAFYVGLLFGVAVWMVNHWLVAKEKIVEMMVFKEF